MENIMQKEVLEVDEHEIKEEFEKVLGTLDGHGKKIEEHDRVILANSKKIEEHTDKITKHDKQIVELQMKDIGFEGRFNSIDLQFVEVKNCLTRMENSQLQSTNLLVNTISNIATANSKSNNEIAKVEVKNEAEITKTKMSNNLAISLKVLALVGACLAGWLSSKYGINIKF